VVHESQKILNEERASRQRGKTSVEGEATICGKTKEIERKYILTKNHVKRKCP